MKEKIRKPDMQDIAWWFALTISVCANSEIVRFIFFVVWIFINWIGWTEYKEEMKNKLPIKGNE